VNALLAKRLSGLIARHGWRVQRTIDGEPNPAHLWETDEGFQASMAGVRAQTLVHDPACYVLYGSALSTASLDGDVAEVGVYRGGTAMLLSRAAGPECAVHLFDTFSGMPIPDADRDLHGAGDFADTSVDNVRRLLSSQENIRLYPGWFPETGAAVADRSFRLVHVDVDIYRSVLDCCQFFYERLLPAGVFVFDDYGWTSTPGARAAVDEFFATRPEHPIYLPTGQAVVVKQ
jgi:hypothetical protein